jgi:hypothetical protein
MSDQVTIGMRVCVSKEAFLNALGEFLESIDADRINWTLYDAQKLRQFAADIETVLGEREVEEHERRQHER